MLTLMTLSTLRSSRDGYNDILEKTQLSQLGETRQCAAEANEIMLSVSSYRAILPKFVFQLTSNHMTPAGIETYTNYMG